MHSFQNCWTRSVTAHPDSRSGCDRTHRHGQPAGAARITIQRELTRDLTPEQRGRLDELLLLKPDTRMSYLAWLRLPPNPPVTGNFVKLIERLSFLRCIGIDPLWAQRIHRNRLLLLSREGEHLTQQHFMRLESERRHAMLVAVVLELLITLTDDSLDMFGKMIGAMFAKAKLRKAEQFHADGKALIQKLGLLARVVRATVDARQNAADPYAAMDKVIPLDQLLTAVDEAEKVAKTEDFECISLLVDYHHSVPRICPSAAECLRVPAPLRRQRTSLAAWSACGRCMPRASVRLMLMHPCPSSKMPGSGMFSPRRETLIGVTTSYAYSPSCVTGSAEVSVIGSRHYKDFDEYLLPQAHYAEMKSAGRLPVSVTVDFAAYIAERKEKLEERIAEVSEKLRAGTLKDVRMNDGLVIITPLKRTEPPEAESIRRQVADALPRIKITDLMMEVDGWTGFLERVRRCAHRGGSR